MTSAQFDSETLELLERIKQNPNPRRPDSKFREAIRLIRSIDRPRAFKAARNMFAIVGAAGFAGELATMHTPLCVLSISLLCSTWYAVYLATR
jgi:hypothetical protein